MAIKTSKHPRLFWLTFRTSMEQPSSDGQGQGTIQNDDSPILSINSIAMPEGNSGTTIFTFTVTSNLPAPASGIAFDIATANNTATSAGGDYVANSVNGATIPPGQTSCTFDVTVNSDTSPELDETFFVNISNPSSGADDIGQPGRRHNSKRRRPDHRHQSDLSGRRTDQRDLYKRLCRDLQSQRRRDRLLGHAVFDSVLEHRRIDLDQNRSDFRHDRSRRLLSDQRIRRRQRRRATRDRRERQH